MPFQENTTFQIHVQEPQRTIF